MKTILADTHVHFYPFYDYERAFNAAFDNLATLSPVSSDEKELVLFLTERYDCNFFKELSSDTFQIDGFKIEVRDEVVFVSRESDSTEIAVVAGRQLVSKEKIEVLALSSDISIEDGLPLRDLISEVSKTDAIPVLNWSPGKWMFSRGAVVKDVVENSEAGSFLLADVAMRPKGFPRPKLLSLGLKRGFKLIAGSDPLPLEGEESEIGRYGVTYSGELQKSAYVAGLRKLLWQEDASIVGGRNSILRSAERFVNNNLKKN